VCHRRRWNKEDKEKGGEAKRITFAHSPVELDEARQQAQALRVRADSGDAHVSPRQWR